MHSIRPFTFALLLCIGSSAAIAAPLLQARSITGAPFISDGQVTIVNYWATWCAPCRAEMPIFDAFYRKHQAQHLSMLAISIDQGVSTRKLRGMTSGFAFPVARLDNVMVARKDIPIALPVTRIYDRTGKLVFQTKGDGRTTIDAATLERIVSPLLASR